jgi:hypothetical protein
MEMALVDLVVLKVLEDQVVKLHQLHLVSVKVLVLLKLVEITLTVEEEGAASMAVEQVLMHLAAAAVDPHI